MDKNNYKYIFLYLIRIIYSIVIVLAMLQMFFVRLFGCRYFSCYTFGFSTLFFAYLIAVFLYKSIEGNESWQKICKIFFRIWIKLIGLLVILFFIMIIQSYLVNN